MKHWTNEELQHVLLKVARRAAVDCEFRALALRDGDAAIAEVSSKPLPKGISYKFVDNSGPVKIVPLPDFVQTDSDELSEEELEGVAGGDNNPPPPPIAGGWSKIAHLESRVKK